MERNYMTQQSQDIDGEQPGDNFGRSVFLGGSCCCCCPSSYWGCNRAQGPTGHVKVFKCSETDTVCITLMVRR